jgi:hypothetical protein
MTLKFLLTLNNGLRKKSDASANNNMKKDCKNIPIGKIKNEER